MCLINFLMLIIIKFFYHIKNCKLKNYTFHNAIIIFDEDKFINIFPNNTTEDEEVRIFFIKKIRKDIKEENIFQKIIYDFERIGKVE